MTELWAAVLLTELSQSAEIARAEHGKLRGESHIPDHDARYSGAVPSFSQIAGFCLLGKSAARLRDGHRADLAHLGQKQACQTRAPLRCTHCEQHIHPLLKGCGDSKLNLFAPFVKRCPVLLVDNQQAVVRERDIRNGYPSTQATRRFSIVALLVFSAKNVEGVLDESVPVNHWQSPKVGRKRGRTNRIMHSPCLRRRARLHGNSLISGTSRYASSAKREKAERKGGAPLIRVY